MIGATLALTFLSFTSFLAWRESAQINLKIGRNLYSASDTVAEETLENGVRKNGGEYLLRYNAALALQESSLTATGGKPNMDKLIRARKHLYAALDIRSDTAIHLAMGQNFAMEGMTNDALAHYNIAFFLGQNGADANNWADIRQHQAEAARDFFGSGNLGIPIIMAFNSVTGFSPGFSKTTVSQFLESFFADISPERWTSATVDNDGNALREIYRHKTPPEKEQIAAGLAGAGFSFLTAYLEGK